MRRVGVFGSQLRKVPPRVSRIYRVSRVSGPRAVFSERVDVRRVYVFGVVIAQIVDGVPEFSEFPEFPGPGRRVLCAR